MTPTLPTDSSLDKLCENSLTKSLKGIRAKNPKKIIMGTLNINSIRYKFEQLKLQISDYLDILVIVESKLDSTFPTSQFIIDGFKEPIRLDRTGMVVVF